MDIFENRKIRFINWGSPETTEDHPASGSCSVSFVRSVFTKSNQNIIFPMVITFLSLPDSLFSFSSFQMLLLI